MGFWDRFKGKKQADEWVKQGQELERVRRLEEALELYERAVDLNPDCLSAWIGKGRVLRTLIKPPKPEVNPEGWPRLTKPDPEPWKVVLSCYERALELDPKFVPGLAGKIECLYMLDRKPEAIECIKEVLQIQPTNKVLRSLMYRLGWNPLDVP